MINGFAHVALYTAKFEETIQFYKDVFDAENIEFFMTDVRGCWLHLGKDILEIFESAEYKDGCFKHIALGCDDTDALFEKALSFGATSLVAPKDITLDLNTPVSARIAFVKGINGEQIELFQDK